MIVDDLELERRLRVTFDQVVPRLVDDAVRPRTSSLEFVDDTHPGRRRRVVAVSLAAVGLIVLTVAGLVASRGTQRAPLPPFDRQSTQPEFIPPPSTSAPAQATTPLTTTETSSADAVVPTATAESDDPALTEVNVTTAAELGIDAAEQWARRYLDALAAGNYEAAAGLSPAGSAITQTDSSLGPVSHIETLTEGAVTPERGSLADQLRDYCEGGDAVCLPARDLVPQWVMVVDGCPDDVDPASCYEQQPGIYIDAADRFPDRWVVQFTLDDRGATARFHPTSARPYAVHLEVTVQDRRVAVRGLPPLRSVGSPDERLPQIELADTGGEWRTVDLPIPGTEHTTTVWTDGTDLCAGACTEFPYPPGGAVGAGGARSETGEQWLHEIAVAHGVEVSMIDAVTGESLQPVLRSDLPDIGNLTVWVFLSNSPAESPYTTPPLRVTYTLADGTSFEAR